MKNLLLRLLVAILPIAAAFGQSKAVTFTLPGNLADTVWVKTYVDKAIKAAPVIVKPPVVAEKKPCGRGPAIWELKDVTNTSMKFQFDGQGVDTLQWEIYLNGAGLIKTDIAIPKTSVVPITYPPLPDGVYELRVRGVSCKSVEDSKRNFPIKSNQSDAGQVITPPVTSPGVGNTVVKKVISGLKENMNIYFVTLPDGSRMFSDSVDDVVTDQRYEYRYGINNHVIRQSVPLRNYKWPANTPLQVWKAIIKKTLGTMFQWGPDGGWWDIEGGRTFSHNDGLPFATFFFQRADSAYDVRRQTAHWMDFMPNMKLPPGKIWVMPIGDIDTPELLISKGVTHFSKFHTVGKPYDQKLLREGRVYDEVPQTQVQFGLQDRGPGASRWVPGRMNENGEWIPVGWPANWNERFFGTWDGFSSEPLTYQQGYEAGLRYTTAYPLIVFENKEQDHAFSGHFPAYRGFYDALMPRLRAEWNPKGIEPLVAHNYFTKADGEGMTLTGQQSNKDLFTKPISEWPKSDLMPGGTLSGTNLLCHAYYLKSADMTRDEPYSFIFSAKVADAIGKKLVLFPQSTHEHNPNNFRAVYYPDGTFFKTTKQEYNPAETITISFIAQNFGAGIIPFGAAPKNHEQFRFSREWHYTSGNLWLKRGANNYSPIDQFPYWNEKEEFAGGTFEYCIAEGVRLYCETFAKVIGGRSSFLDFRIDGKGEFRAVDKDYVNEVVNAYREKRGLVYAQEKDGKLAVFYLNPYADTDLHTVEYKYGGKVYSMKVHSTIVHPVLHQL